MYRMMRRAVTTTTVAVVLSTGALSTTAPASADPAGYRQYNGTGSQTTQNVLAALAGDTAASGVTHRIGSYDAFIPAGPVLSSQIRTTPKGPLFDRPQSDGQGVRALSDAILGIGFGSDRSVITGQVDFARSAFGPASSGTSLTYVPFARDSVGYAFVGPRSRLGKLTTSQLQYIFTANGSPAVINGVPVTGVLPRSDSATTRIFLAAIGVTSVGTSVVQTLSPDNDGRILDGRANAVVPFSTSQWVAQRNMVIPDSTATYGYGSPDGKPAIATRDGALVPVPSFANTAPFGHSVYNVIATTEVTGDGVATLLIGRDAPLCSDQAVMIIRHYGFTTINTRFNGSPGCGSTAVTGPYTP